MLSNKESRNKYDATLKQMDMKNKTDTCIADASNLLSLSCDFNFDLKLNTYKRDCERCSGYLLLNKQDLNNLLLENDDQTQQFILTLECDSCSFTSDIMIL